MLASEKQEILAHLQEGQKALALALDGVDEEEAAWKPATREWSILACVEHLVAAFIFKITVVKRPYPSVGRRAR
jgi:hypothetical protein